MRLALLIALCFSGSCVSSQTVIPTTSTSSRFLNNLVPGDSVVYYQCHVEEAVQQLTTATGQTLTGRPQKYSITEKFVVKRGSEGYYADYYTSSLTVFPNRRFSALKIREKDYWLFKKERTIPLSETLLKAFAALEKQGREAIEYDYAITKYTTNQLIVKVRKDFKQLVIDNNYVLSRLLMQESK